MTRPEMLAADHIRELTQHFTTTERVTRPVMRPNPTTDLHGHTYPAWEPTGKMTHALHTVTHPPLLQQLADAAIGYGPRSDDDAGKTTFTSKPAAHLEATDLLARIDHQSATLGDEHGIDEPDLTKRLLALSGFIGGEPHRQVRSWWAQARLVTQWDTPAHRPHGAPCPSCWESGTLRIRLDDELATCTGCGDTWDRTLHPSSGSLDVLAQHVKWCTDHEVTKARHWKVDDDGFPVECVDCLAFRQAWAAWKSEQARGERVGA